jgi:formamidopyrimidine-DNA glycosylase
MPELPEVETTMRGIAPHMKNQQINHVVVRDSRLRWPIPVEVNRAESQTVVGLRRRGKYLLIDLQKGGLVIHLGMSGSLRVLSEPQSPGKHDHFDIEMTNGVCIRYNDPRRFGAFLWAADGADSHSLLAQLGPEPLSDDFTADYLYQQSRGRKVAVKNFIMNGHVVVGVGNIYASESLFMAGIHPSRAAGRVSKLRYQGLVEAVRDVLSRAIQRGGTTLRDFVNSDGAPGYFAQELLVYDRGGRDCFQCGGPIRQKVIGQRSSYFCPECQR